MVVNTSKDKENGLHIKSKSPTSTENTFPETHVPLNI